MGYTHYWKLNRESSKSLKENWKNIKPWLQKVLDFQAEKIQREYNDSKKPALTDKFLAFNGKGDEGHETFYFQLNLQKFTFCKTSRKEYDLAVCLCLAVIQSFVDIKLRSDGFSTGKAGCKIEEKASGGGISYLERGADGNWDEVIKTLRGWGFNCHLTITGERAISWGQTPWVVVDYQFEGKPPRAELSEQEAKALRESMQDVLFST